MKGLLTKIIAAFAAIATIGIACQCFANSDGKHDWKDGIAQAGSDMVVLLHYQPTDGASYEGKVRKSVAPSRVNP